MGDIVEISINFLEHISVTSHKKTQAHWCRTTFCEKLVKEQWDASKRNLIHEMLREDSGLRVSHGSHRSLYCVTTLTPIGTHSSTSNPYAHNTTQTPYNVPWPFEIPPQEHILMLALCSTHALCINARWVPSS